MTAVKVLFLSIGLFFSVPSIVHAGLLSGPDFVIEDSQNSALPKRAVSKKYGISIQFPSGWGPSKQVSKYSALKFRSENGKGFESVNIQVIPMGEKKYTIEDFETPSADSHTEILDSGYFEIAGQKALWQKRYNETAFLKKDEVVKRLLVKPSFMYKERAPSNAAYQIKIVAHDRLYTVSCGVLDQNRDAALLKLEANWKLFDAILHSFNFETQ